MKTLRERLFWEQFGAFEGLVKIALINALKKVTK